MVAAFLLLVLSAEPSGCSAELFRIERSKNANVVLYEATSLESDRPVTANWLLLASTGARQPLNFFEKLLAYGFQVKRAASAQSAVLTLKALKNRTLLIASRGGCLAATATIGGVEAVLKRVYVTTDERGAAPSVKSIELFGVDAVTGEPRSEKIVAGK